MSNGWLDHDLWALVQRSVPVACVDLVPLRAGLGDQMEIGLIHRKYPSGDRLVWCQVGGRIELLETVRQAIRRHLTETLDGATVELPEDPQPGYVMQWFPHPSAGSYGEDPRKHAVALSFVLEVHGVDDAIVAGEASAFSWFTKEQVLTMADDLWPGTLTLLEQLKVLG